MHLVGGMPTITHGVSQWWTSCEKTFVHLLDNFRAQKDKKQSNDPETVVNYFEGKFQGRWT